MGAGAGGLPCSLLRSGSIWSGSESDAKTKEVIKELYNQSNDNYRDMIYRNVVGNSYSRPNCQDDSAITPQYVETRYLKGIKGGYQTGNGVRIGSYLIKDERITTPKPGVPYKQEDIGKRIEGSDKYLNASDFVNTSHRVAILPMENLGIFGDANFDPEKPFKQIDIDPKGNVTETNLDSGDLNWKVAGGENAKPLFNPSITEHNQTSGPPSAPPPNPVLDDFLGGFPK